jgi:hypothetical protein
MLERSAAGRMPAWFLGGLLRSRGVAFECGGAQRVGRAVVARFRGRSWSREMANVLYRFLGIIDNLTAIRQSIGDREHTLVRPFNQAILMYPTAVLGLLSFLAVGLWDFDQAAVGRVFMWTLFVNYLILFFELRFQKAVIDRRSYVIVVEPNHVVIHDKWIGEAISYPTENVTFSKEIGDALELMLGFGTLKISNANNGQMIRAVPHVFGISRQLEEIRRVTAQFQVEERRTNS